MTGILRRSLGSRRTWVPGILLSLAISLGNSSLAPGQDVLRPSDYLDSTDIQVISYINQMIRQPWKDSGVTSSAKATDNEWCRRVYLDIIGRIPSAEEAEAFALDRSKEKRAKLVRDLMNNEQYQVDAQHKYDYLQEYARNWTTIWTNTLIGRNGGMDRRRPVNREGLQQYLRRSFAANKPYDQMVNELMTASGSNLPGSDGYNGAVNFMLDNLDDNAVQATAKTARLFLGLQVQCTQCHNHPFNDWKQDQFWSLNAFFRQTAALRTREGNQIVQARLVDQDYAGEGGNPREAEVYYELRNGTLKVAYPTWVDGKTTINPSGYVQEVNRRGELAKLIVNSDYVNTAIVNRIWAHFFGYGFTKPIDDMGPHNPASHPELLERLAKDFKGGGSEITDLIRWFTLSEPYALSSKFGSRNKQDDPALGNPPLFSRFYLRQMSAEQLYESLVTAINADQTTQGTPEEKERRKAGWLSQFTIAFGTDEGDEATTFNGTIPQTLMMMNGELINSAVRADKGGLLYNVAMDPKRKSATDKIGYLYLSALSRRPTRKELSDANALWEAHKGNSVAAAQDVWWALLNSNEFILNH